MNRILFFTYAPNTACMSTTASRTRTTKFTSNITVMLVLTLSSCLFRESLSLVAQWVNNSGNGVISRNQLFRLTAPGRHSKNIQSIKSKRLNNQLFFQNIEAGEMVRLAVSPYQKEITNGVKNPNLFIRELQNQNRYRNSCISYQKSHEKNNGCRKYFVGRHLSTISMANEYQENDSTESKENKHDEKSSKCSETSTISSQLQSTPDDRETIRSKIVCGREPFVNVLSIDPKHIELYERTGEEGSLSEGNDENENGPVSGNPFGDRNFINMFRGSANYIASHRNTLAVFHIPGDLMDENPPGFRDLMNDISLSWLLGMKIVIVAGCRYQINKRHKKSEDGRQEHMGMAVTDHESLRIVKEEAGYVRFEVERQLARALKSGSSSGSRFKSANRKANSNGSDGPDDWGGNVVSGNFFSAQPFGVINGVDYKYSGFIRRMEVNKIHQVHQNRDIILLTSLGFSPTGEVFNVNSEYLAAYAAGELGASKIIYFLEKNAALRHKIHGSDIPHLRVNDGRKLLDLNRVRTETKGFVYMDDCPFGFGAEQLFLVKMGWGMNALRAGVKRVHLISPHDGALLQELYTRDGSGTMISGDLYDGIQSATVDDATAIFEVIAPLVEKGILVERTKAELERDIDQYHVYTRDDLLIACGRLKMFENGFAEIGCLVVNPLYRAKGRGDAMLGYLERLCVQNGATNLFVLSTQTMEWFVERGFDEVDVERLPPSRQVTYNQERGSKIYMKRVSSLRDLDASELFWDR